MREIRTVSGDLLDLICLRHYGQHKGTAEAVLAANPGLAAVPQPYAAGIVILLPDIAPPDRRSQTVSLWD